MYYPDTPINDISYSGKIVRPGYYQLMVIASLHETL